MEGIRRLPHLHSTPFPAASKVEETDRDRGGLIPWHGIEDINTRDMTICCNESDEEDRTAIQNMAVRSMMCPSCGHNIQLKDQARINELPGLPAGVKFDPSDQEILEHLEAKVVADARKLHPLIDEFIPTIEGENGICCTHPEKLPGLSKDGQIRHFFHRPSKAYTTGTRKRRKVHNDSDGSETRWHKTGKTRPVLINGTVKGFKKILVLYTNYGRQRKPEKTNWVMHQYHLGNNEEEKDGELVVSKIFYQTQPRQCGSATKDTLSDGQVNLMMSKTTNNNVVEYYNPSYISYGGHAGHINKEASHPHLIHPHGVLQGDGSSFIQFTPDMSKER